MDVIDADQTSFSAISIWEVTTKNFQNRAEFQVDAAVLRESLVARGLTEVGSTSLHALAAGGLPPHHSDPFY